MLRSYVLAPTLLLGIGGLKSGPQPCELGVGDGPPGGGGARLREEGQRDEAARQLAV